MTDKFRCGQRGFLAVWAAVLLGFLAVVCSGGYFVVQRYAERSLRRSLDLELQAAVESAVVLAVGRINHDAAVRSSLDGATEGKEIAALKDGDIAAKAYALPSGDNYRILAVASSPRHDKYEKNREFSIGTRAKAVAVKYGDGWKIEAWER